MAGRGPSSLEDLDLTREEVDNITNAMKHKEFRQMLCEYVEEINDPVNKAKYEEEITLLEKERGVNVTFIKSKPGYVLKTSVNGTTKAFINICECDEIARPTSTPCVQDQTRGLQWKLPHSLAPVREDFDKSRKRCQVYDVTYHPDVLRLANSNNEFKKMVNSTACESIESNFGVKIDKNNLIYPKLNFKGVQRSTVIRKKIADFQPSNNEDKIFLDKICPAWQENVKQEKQDVRKTKEAPETVNTVPGYTVPKFHIKQVNHIDLGNFTYDRDCKLNVTHPSRLDVIIELPLLKDAKDVKLNVEPKLLSLVCEERAKYKLEVTLPYSVYENQGSAKFDCSQRKLIIELPVIQNPVFTTSFKEDSGVDSDHSFSTSPSDENSLITEIKSEERVPDIDKNDECRTLSESTSFLNPDVSYVLPEYNCHILDNIIAFTLHVKNVEPDSVEHYFFEDNHGIHVKFSSMSSGFFPVYYSFCCKIPSHEMERTESPVEVWDNNIVIQISCQATCDTAFTSYLCGLSQDDLIERHFNKAASFTAKQLKSHTDVNVKAYLDSDDDITVEIKPTDSKTETIPDDKQNDTDAESESIVKPQSTDVESCVHLDHSKLSCNNIEEHDTQKCEKVSIYSESSGDELSASLSPTKGKGILKQRSNRTYSRSISESSIDDCVLPNSLDNYYGTASDSCILEEKEESDSGSKKTVRFSDIVSKQVFRSNSSILGQKKKNQRKSRNKKRAQERRHSESELSENEDRKENERKPYNRKKERLDSGMGSDTEKEHKTEQDDKETKVENKFDFEFKSDLIFDLDM